MQAFIPDTGIYLIGGLIIGLGLVIGLAASILWRYRALQRDLETLQQLESE